MKKAFIVATLVSLITTSAFALVEGKINTVKVDSDGTIKISLLKADQTVTYEQQLDGTADAIKAMYAMALTAKSSNADVGMNLAGGGKINRLIIK